MDGLRRFYGYEAGVGEVVRHFDIITVMLKRNTGNTSPPAAAGFYFKAGKPMAI